MIDLLFLVLPDTLLLDLAGPAEAFRLANQQLARRGQPPAFRLRYLGPDAGASSSVGLQLAGLEPLPATLDAPSWVFLLGRPGEAQSVVQRGPAWIDTRDWLSRRLAPALLHGAPGGHRLLTVCTGALLAADAGLVGRRRATTHHEMLDALRAMAPQAEVVANRVFVLDGPLATSAGITAGIDLALHLIGEHCGASLAAAVAQTMVVFVRRGPQDPELSPMLAWRRHLHPALHRVQDAVSAAPAQDWPLARMAELAHVTPRHLTRLFREHAGVTPRDYVEELRRTMARQALEHGASRARAAKLAGFSSEQQLRRALQRATPA
ncbi:GlxA family transcriptional regulator [Caldimonas tepidiphila]|uniref:GlxA family transcriptional regulator n=1 Tax=Caldimonas tepidiphila TaxID=2315841 RepID=UPI000E5BE05B|nr:helix-turn-helix domain-containing protein [Caldimonas tepidiphila]